MNQSPASCNHDCLHNGFCITCRRGWCHVHAEWHEAPIGPKVCGDSLRAELADARDQARWATAHLGKVWAALTGGHETQTLAPEEVLREAVAMRARAEKAARVMEAARPCAQSMGGWLDRAHELRAAIEAYDAAKVK